MAFGEQTEESIAAAQDWLTEIAEMTTAELFRTLAEWVGDRALVDRCSLLSYDVGALKRTVHEFPDAYFLHLTRHPASTMESLVRLRRKHPVESMGLRWRTANSPDPDRAWLQPHLAILEALADVPVKRRMRLQGESLLENPALYLSQIAEWLGKRTDAEAVTAMMHPENSPFAQYGPSNARYGNDPNFLEDPSFRRPPQRADALEGCVLDGKTIPFSAPLRAYAMLFGY